MIYSDGKLMFIVMDCESYEVKTETGTSFLKPILTVKNFVAERGGEALLEDPALLVAASSVENTGGLKTKEQLAEESQRKSKALEHLIQSHCSGRW